MKLFAAIVAKQGFLPEPTPKIQYSDLTDLQIIGEGGFGNIYRANHPQWGTVVYKELKSTFIKDESKAGAELKNEAKAHVLKHVNIVTLYAMIFEDGHYGVVLEFVPLGCLEEYIYKYKVDWPHTTKLFVAHGVVRGMEYLHSIRPHPVIHGDLKIQNVLVGDGLVAKVCDFGLAKWKAHSKTNTQSQSRRAGTVSHTPPETWSNINHPRTVKYDVYSFAVLLWELFTQQEPFKDVKHRDQIRDAVCSGQRLDLNVITGPDSLVTRVKDWISRCWEQDPDSRPAFTDLNGEFMTIYEITKPISPPHLGQHQVSSTEQLAELNEMLKLNFQKLHKTMVDSVDAASIIDFLFQEGVVGSEEMRTLVVDPDDPRKQCRDMLALLHTSENPQAFVKLYLAIKQESHLNWLVDRVDQFTDQSLTDILQQQFYQSVVNRYHSEYKVGQLIHTLPEGEPAWGMTTFEGELYVLRAKTHEIHVYHIVTYCLLRRLSVPNSGFCGDMISCEHFRCVYISDHVAKCIHRLDIGQQGAITRWPVNDGPDSLSVNAAHNVIVACPYTRKIKEFSSHGDLRRELTLPGDIINLWHAVQLASGEFIVCHGGTYDQINRVCKVSGHDGHIIQSHGGKRGGGPGYFREPVRLAVDTNESVFVADAGNHRVTLLSPTLDYLSHVVTRDKLKWGPGRMYVDIQRRRLYVGDNEWDGDDFTLGRIVVFGI